MSMNPNKRCIYIRDKEWREISRAAALDRRTVAAYLVGAALDKIDRERMRLKMTAVNRA